MAVAQSSTNSTNILNSQLIFTTAAAEKVWGLLEEEGNFELKLRVFVTGGGCSGFQYGFTFDEDVLPDDTIIKKIVERKGEQYEVVLLVDAMSLQYLKDAEIDYREDINGAQFVIRNPNAETTCGCGSSFSVKDDDDGEEEEAEEKA